MTRLLLQKPAQHADLDENSRIALSILTEDGWTLDRIGTEISVTVTRTPVALPGIADQLADCEARYAALRVEVARIQQGSSSRVIAGTFWIAAMVLALASLFVRIGHPEWNVAVQFLCILGWLGFRIRAKKGGA
jgi:hypothetical protein